MPTPSRTSTDADRGRRPGDPRGRGLRGPDDAARRRGRRRPRAVAVQARRRPRRAGPPDHRRRRGGPLPGARGGRLEPATRRKDLAAIATAFRAFAHAHPEAYALLFRRLPEGWRTDVDLASPGFARAVRDGRGDRRPRATGSRPPARWSPGRTGSSSMELAGAFRLGGRRRPCVRLRRPAHRRSDQRAAARRATMNGMRTRSPHRRPAQDRRRRPRPRRSRAARGLRARLDRPLRRARRARSSGRRAWRRSRRSCRRAGRRRSRSCRRAGTPASSAAASRATARCCVSLRRLTTIEPVDVDGGTVVAGAGATIGDVHRAAESAGWSYGVDLAARDSATVGGTIATNAGGIHVFRNGMTRDQVLGVEAVLGDGSVVRRLAAPRKDNTGLRPRPAPRRLRGHARHRHGRTAPPASRASTVGSWPSSGSRASTSPSASRARSAARSPPSTPSSSSPATRSTSPSGTARSARSAPATPPTSWSRSPTLVDPEPALVAALHRAPDVDDAVVATDGPARARLWQIREGLPEALNREGVPHSIDAALPLAAPARVHRHARRRRSSGRRPAPG